MSDFLNLVCIVKSLTFLNKNNIYNWQIWQAGFIFIKLHSIHPGSQHYSFIAKLLFHSKFLQLKILMDCNLKQFNQHLITLELQAVSELYTWESAHILKFIENWSF